MLLFIIAILTIISFFGYRSYESQKKSWKITKNIPGPRTLPFLGSTATLMTVTPENILNKCIELFGEYGRVIRMYDFNRPFIFSCCPEMNEKILNTQLDKAQVYKVFRPLLGMGLVTSSVHDWQIRRKIFTPAFHFKVLETFVDVFDQQSSILVDCLADKADGRTAFDAYPYLSLTLVDMFVETAIGVKVNAQGGKNHAYTDAMHDLTDLITWRFLRAHLYNEWIFTILYPFRKMRQTSLVRTLHAFTSKFIEDRRKILKENELKAERTIHVDEYNDADDNVAVKKRMAFMDVLLQATIDGQPISDEIIADEVSTFTVGGTDTSSRAIAYTMHTLARHPQIQNKVLEEIHRVFGENNPKPYTLARLNELKYMNSVIKESLRMFPPASFIARQIVEEFTFEHSRLGEVVLPKGTQIIICIFPALRDPDIFEHPDQFIPERHDNKNVQSAFIPFSGGPRNCIGQTYAMFAMKVTLTNILRAYELLPLGPDVKPKMGFLTNSETGMQLGLRKRVPS